MQSKQSNSLRELAFDKDQKMFLILAGFFLTALVLTNLIAGRFFTLKIPFTSNLWYLSSGVIVYPFTFVVTDVISEVYGHKKANWLILVGFLVSLFTVLIILVSTWFPIWENSPVDEASYLRVFGLAPGIVFGSMIAYLSAQFIDVRLFEFWRKLTKGKFLWLRNNASTVFSQAIDTSLVVVIALIIYPSLTGVSTPITWKEAGTIIIGQYLFKALIALVDTPFVYLAVSTVKKYIDSE